jgi:lipopolysaccharide biosynthesis glycosyltransferase
MLSSLVAQNAAESLHVHLLYDGSLPAADVKSLSGLVTEAGGRFDAIDVPPDSSRRWPDSDRFPANAWYRVRLPELLPDVRRVLYIDADTLIVAPLQELWDTELDCSPLAAVTQYLYPAMVARVADDPRLSVADYFNSGVLIFDLARWRSESITDEIAAYVGDRSHQLVWPDQDALNAVLHARRHVLHPRWNAMTGIWELPDRQLPYGVGDLSEARADPAIVHFIGPYKPWHFRCKSRYRAEWWRCLERTPWRDRQLEGRSLRHAVFKPLPTVWAYNLEVAIDRERAKLAARRAR